MRRVVLLAALALLGCRFVSPSVKTPYPTSPASGGLRGTSYGVSVKTLNLYGPAGETLQFQVEIADSEDERRAGLMGRAAFPEHTGMLFIFPDEQERTFWMKNTFIPLDILFFDRAGTLVSWETMEPCTEDPCPMTLSHAPAMFALEIPAGTAAEEGIGEGWGMDTSSVMVSPDEP